MDDHDDLTTSMQRRRKCHNASWQRERLSLSAFLGTEHIGVHIVHISRVMLLEMLLVIPVLELGNKISGALALKQVPYMFHTKFHLLWPTFYSSSSKCTRTGERVSVSLMWSYTLVIINLCVQVDPYFSWYWSILIWFDGWPCMVRSQLTVAGQHSKGHVGLLICWGAIFINTLLTSVSK